MKNYISPVLFTLAIVMASAILGNAFMNRNKATGKIAVTGLGTTDFESDLIVWSGSFSSFNYEIKNAYSQLERKRKIIENYLISKGINKDEIIFTSVESQQQSKRLYNEEGDYMGDEFTGYSLSQGLEIKSENVDVVEKTSREISELLNKGVQFSSYAPRYYYTKLADLKIEMISMATENAKLRADKIAENSGAALGDLLNGKMGIFQITGQYSTESYSWGGSLNTSSREKTASITMKLTYEVD